MMKDMTDADRILLKNAEKFLIDLESLRSEIAAREELYKKIQTQNPSLNIIASGGVASMDDLNQLKEMNLFGVIVGKAFYEGRITLDELASFSNNTLC